MTVNNNTAKVPPMMWKPNSPEATQMEKFRVYVNETHNLNLRDYNELYQWSIDNISEFWPCVWSYTNIISSSQWDKVVDTSLSMDKIPTWFEGSLLNYAENCLWNRDSNKVALYATGEYLKLKDSEQLEVNTVSYNDLYFRVEMMAGALRKLGISVGDRVVGYLPNCPEAIIAFLACASLGAIWSSTSPDFGVNGVLDRFSQIQPKLLFSVNATVYNGKGHDHLKKLQEVVEGLESLEKVVVLPIVPDHSMDLTNIPNATDYAQFIATGTGNTLEFTQLPFNHPLYILFSSGTTGKPKCLVHTAGGMLIQHKKEHIIHGNLTPEDVLLQYTTTGWMMWNWLVSGLSLGATLVLFDGSPFRPSSKVMFELIDKLKITAFGTSAKYIQALEETGLNPHELFDLSSLHSIYSTGSPLKSESFDYVYKSIKADLCLGSITGGTDICSLFAGHNYSLPVYRGEIQCRSLGMAIASYDSNYGKPIFDESGDLVCTKPFPCMPVYFWNDKDGVKYRNAYFDCWPGIWYHGDFVLINSQTGGVLMLGRSDGTLNPSGVRFGSAEIYNTIEYFDHIEDSLVVGQKIGDDERVVLFLKTKAESQFNPELIANVKMRIRTILSPRHVPAVILPISDIPYTVNGKKVEVAVKKLINGVPLSSIATGTLANPTSLDQFIAIPQLKLS